MLVRKELDLDVTGPREPALEVNGCIAEGRERFGARSPDSRREFPRLEDDAHALAATARNGLHHHRVADVIGERSHVTVWSIRRQRPSGAGHDRSASTDGGIPRRGLASHERDGTRGGTDERQPGFKARGSKLLVFRKEPVAGVNTVGARRPRRIDDAIDPQVALSGRVGTNGYCDVGHSHVQCGTVALGVDGDGRNAHFAAGADDPHGDLAAIGYENPSQPKDSNGSDGLTKGRIDEFRGTESPCFNPSIRKFVNSSIHRMTVAVTSMVVRRSVIGSAAWSNTIFFPLSNTAMEFARTTAASRRGGAGGT